MASENPIDKNEPTPNVQGEPNKESKHSESPIPPASAKPKPQVPHTHYNTTCEPKQNWWDKAKPYVELGGVGLLAIYTAFTVAMYFVNKQAANAATSANTINRESLISTQRAFIAFNRFDTKNTLVRHGSEDKQMLGFSAILRNDGNTPAVNVINSFTISPQNKEPTSKDFIRMPKRSDYFPTFVGPKGELPLGPVNSYDIDLLGEKLPSTMKQLLETKKIERNIFFFGWVAYRDVFPETKVHITEFCHQLVTVSLDSKSTEDNPIYHFGTTLCQAYNCTDEYCENYKQLEALALGK